MPENEPRLCKRCGQPVIENAERFDVFEGMHWLCFHLEYEHEGDPDVPCRDISCPWFQLEVFGNLLRERGVDPLQALYEEFERRRSTRPHKELALCSGPGGRRGPRDSRVRPVPARPLNVGPLSL